MRLCSTHSFDSLVALTFLQRDELFGQGAYDVQMEDAPTYYSADASDSDNADIDSDEAEAFQRPPAGEEGMFHSHAGKEAIFDQIWQKCRPGRGDSRRRAMRVQLMINAWRSQIPALVDAYLLLKQCGPMNSDDVPEAWGIQVIGLEGAQFLVFNFQENGIRRFAHVPTACEVNESLVRHGYIGASPDRVSIAFPLRTLEIYRQVHRVCPRYSLDALSKTLMNIHHAAHRTTLAEQLSAAYDAYLEIMRQVDSRVHVALGRDATWYSKNVCPPCMYKTENEPPLKFSLLSSMDGNNSLKLVDSAFRAGSVRPDDRRLNSFRWLTPDQVNVYKNEVADSQKKARRKTTTVSPSNVDHAPSILTSNETEELAKCLNTCVERWKAAGPEARKKMFALFAVAGIFLSVCRHGHVLVMCDMIRSGELCVNFFQ
ncbi:hypothetical protein B0H14DRAFT_2347032 [Mycena olivaceomarginata]|nr:hypothetical protein B0H14DRAFT_2347032 [Mycena olivaceomarginata]